MKKREELLSKWKEEYRNADYWMSQFSKDLEKTENSDSLIRIIDKLRQEKRLILNFIEDLESLE